MTTGRINQVSILSNPEPPDGVHQNDDTPPAAPKLTLPSRARVIDRMCVCWAPRADRPLPGSDQHDTTPFPKPSSEVLPGPTNAPEAAPTSHIDSEPLHAG